jgi:hypothetical protein
MTNTRNLLIHLVTWQLTTLTWLSALCHLDLDVIRVNKVLSGYTETT